MNPERRNKKKFQKLWSTRQGVVIPTYGMCDWTSSMTYKSNVEQILQSYISFFTHKIQNLKMIHSF